MIDYAPLLQRACERLSPNTPETRAQFFTQAHSALKIQLQSVRPHLTDEAIHQELDRFYAVTQALEKNYAYGRTPTSNIPAPPLQPILSSSSDLDLGPAMDAYLYLPYWRQKRFLLGAFSILALLLGSLTWYWLQPLHRPLFHHETPSSLSVGKTQDRLYKQPDSLDKSLPLSSSQSESRLKIEDRDGLSQSTELSITQKAFLVEEDEKASGEVPDVITGQAIWRLGTSDTEQGQPTSPTVETTITIPQKNLVVQMILSKNTDFSLPASHTLKITFSATAASGAKHLSQLKTIGSPRFKDQRDGRGAPLIGETVPVLPNMFLMGLSNDTEDQAYNLNLLKSPGWIDIPILFNDKQHALITFEKGVFGRRIIDKALEAWQ